MARTRRQPSPIHRLVALLATEPARWFSYDELADHLQVQPAKHVEMAEVAGLAIVQGEAVRFPAHPDPGALQLCAEVLSRYGIELTPQRPNLRLVV